MLLTEVIQLLDPRPGRVIVDGTSGGGGHLLKLASAVAPDGLVIGIDRDPAAIDQLRPQVEKLPIELFCASYTELPLILGGLGRAQVDAVLLDLGLSSDQLADAERGFSFNVDGPLDLRFNPHQGEPAWRLLQRLSAQHLADLIYEYGEERHSRRIARAIVASRSREPIRSARQLARVVRQAVPAGRNQRIDPATRTFQALRIAVNDELKELDAALNLLPDCLSLGGTLAIISFHSLEDRRVKQAFRDDSRLEVITRKPIRPSSVEVTRNPRSRSAKLRGARRV